jgi:DNA-binding beta-propeller fold protein YncE
VFAGGCVIGMLGIAGTSAANSGWEFVIEFGNGPQDIAVDSSHNVYVLDVGYDRVQVFTAGGQYLREWAVLANPRSIAIDEGDVVYVLTDCRVVGYTTMGATVLGWDSCLGQGDLQQGIGVDVRDGVVFIGTPNAMLKFATSGTPLAQFMDYIGWTDVFIVPDGSVWCVNSDASRGLVRHYSADGDVLTEWNTILPDEETSSPRGLALDSRERVFVADNGGRVKIFTSNGTLDDMIEVPLRFLFPVELDDDVLYVGATFPDQVMKFRYKLVPVAPGTWGGIKSQFRDVSR